MAVDNLLGAEIVLADGEIVHTDADHHPDLFWAIRGGSGNFGVVTRFDFRLYPLTETLSGLLVYPFPMAKEVLQHGRAIREQAPDDLMVYSGMLTGPDGQRMVGTIVCWSGDMEEGERVLAPIRAWGSPVLDTIQPMPYSQVNMLLTQQFSTVKLRGYWKQSLLPRLADEVIDLLIEHFERAPSPLTIVALTDEHGAQRRVDPAATAFPHRDSPLAVLMLSSWLDPADDDVNIAWAKTMSSALEPWSTGGRYVNESEDERISGVFGENLPRLREIKGRYDPDNFFRANFNIAPA
jgi:FAD/FMN-containing dehydrogenase